MWTRHRRWHAADWPLSGSATSVPTPSRDGCGWQSTGTSLWVYRHGNHGTRAGCGWFSDQPSFHTNSSSAPSRPEHEAILLDHPQQTMVLMKCGLPRSPCGLALHQSLSNNMPLEDVDDCSRVRPTQPAIALCRMPSWASASTCPIPIGVGWGIIRIISENWEKNMQLLIRTCQSAKADFGKWLHKLPFWTSTIPFGIQEKVRLR